MATMMWVPALHCARHAILFARHVSLQQATA